MQNRRRFLKMSAGLSSSLAAGIGTAAPHGCSAPSAGGIEVNDMQSQLNATCVNDLRQPETVCDLQKALRDARRQRRSISVSGGRHSMGGQQFGRGMLHLDMRSFHQVVEFDRTAGLITVEAGIEWPELIEYLLQAQSGEETPWTLREKQTGVDRVTIGGAVSSNIHGRGLKNAPFVADVESIDLLGADGKLRTCNRRENAELFSLVVGGYGLFGLVTHVTLRLVRRTQIQRVVEIIPVRDLIPWVDQRVAEGFLFGDCQYSTDLSGEADAHPGVFSCYRPLSSPGPIPPGQRVLSAADWIELYRLARTDKPAAFAKYSDYYRSTNGQIYWSDTHQLAGDFSAHRQVVSRVTGTEMITEVYVSRENFVPFMGQVRRDMVEHDVDMTYGTIRFIEQDTETFLPWARQSFVCIVCNLHVMHTEAGKQKAATDFRRIIARAVEYGGSYFLTYHRYATPQQVMACYPQFEEFLRLKRKHDPQELFQSNWYRHYKTMFNA